MSARLLLLFLTATVAPAADVDFAFRWAGVVRYWEWSRLWLPDGLAFPDATHTPGLTISATVFASGEYGTIHWGFCSQSMGICHAYYADGVVHGFPDSLRMAPGEREIDAVRRLATATHFDSLTTRPGMRITLPKLQLPRAVTRRTSIQAKVFRSMGPLPPSRPGCKSRIAFADESFPQVPVLIDCPGRKGVQLITRGLDPTGKPFWYGTAGGWHPSVELYRQYLPLMAHGEPIR